MTRNALALLAATGLCGPAMAQTQDTQRQRTQDQQRWQDQQRTQDQQRWQDQQRTQQDRERQQQWSQRQGRDGQSSLDWTSTTVVGYDLDGDGTVDTYYAASRYDIERMRRQADEQRRQMSDRDRQRMDQMQRQAHDRRAMRQGQGQRTIQTQGAADVQPKTVQGRIQSVKDFNLIGIDQPRSVARVQTDDGQRVAVLLGPARQVDQFDLGRGDNVTLRVRPGSIDNQKVLVADRIRVGDRTHRIDQQKIERLKRISGEVVDVKKTALNNRDGQQQEHLLAKVRNEDGYVQVVTFGPASQRAEQRLSEGEKICVLASPTTINGNHLYVARKLSHDGESTSLSTYGKQQRDGDARSQREGM